MRGHVAPAKGARLIGPEDAPLGAVLADGRRLARCLRCDMWIEHEPPEGADVDYEHLPALAMIPKPRRGAVLEEAIVIRIIALNKATHAVAFSILAIAALMIQTRLGSLKSFAERVLAGITSPLSDTGQYANKTWLNKELEKLLDLNAGTVKLVLIVALIYATIEWTEAIGLWLERRWAEYLTVIATAGFLPLEIHELLHRVTALRAIALIVNVALLVWLIRNKRLFGMRGGAHAMHENVDWDAILTSPTPALGRRVVRPLPASPPTVRAQETDQGIDAADD